MYSVHYSSSETVGIVLCPSTGDTGVLTQGLTRALVLHHTPPTQRVGITCTTDTVYTLGTLLDWYLEHLQRGWAGADLDLVKGGGIIERVLQNCDDQASPHSSSKYCHFDYNNITLGGHLD